MDVIPSLESLAEQNVSGVAFLLAYGVSWLVCGLIWTRAGERTAALATLFQGLVAFPLALGLSWLIGAIGQDRPVSAALTQLSVLIGTSQLLGLPLLVLLVVRREYSWVPVTFATICAMHFVFYSWLYRTPVHLVLAVLIVALATTVTLTAPADRPRSGPARVCLATGMLMLGAVGVLLLG